MSPEEQLHLAAAQRRAEGPARQARLRDESRLRLRRALERKLSTSFVGAISRFEEHFGALWGHGKPEGSLTENERRWRELWSRCRTEVLDNGNAQARAALAELSRYAVEWEGYRLDLTVAPPV